MRIRRMLRLGMINNREGSMIKRSIFVEIERSTLSCFFKIKKWGFHGLGNNKGENANTSIGFLFLMKTP
jgi:hypothetical protein